MMANTNNAVNINIYMYSDKNSNSGIGGIVCIYEYELHLAKVLFLLISCIGQFKLNVYSHSVF